MCLKFIDKKIGSILVSREEEEEMYCLMIKAVLGINVCQGCYRLVEQKMVDHEKYQLIDIISHQKREEKRRKGYYDLRELTSLEGD